MEFGIRGTPYLILGLSSGAFGAAFLGQQIAAEQDAVTRRKRRTTPPPETLPIDPALAEHRLRKTDNLRKVQKALGHASPTVTANLYAHVPFEDMQQALSGLYD